MSGKKSLSPKEALDERLREHCRLGRTKTEAADIEGCDEQTAAKATKNTTLVWEKHTPNKPYIPPGVRTGTMLRFSAQLTRTFRDLSRRHNNDVYKLSQLTGLTHSEQRRVIKFEAHNWTFGQIFRLAEASGKAPEDLLQAMISDALAEKKGLEFGPD